MRTPLSSFVRDFYPRSEDGICKHKNCRNIVHILLISMLLWWAVAHYGESLEARVNDCIIRALVSRNILVVPRYRMNVDRSKIIVDNHRSNYFSSARWSARTSSSSCASILGPVRKRDMESTWWLSTMLLYFVSKSISVIHNIQIVRRPDSSEMLRS